MERTKYKLQIIDNMQGNGTSEKEALNSSLAHKRKAKETQWIKILHTAHLYGTNKIGDKTMTSKDELIGSKSPLVESKYSRTNGNDAKTNVIPGNFFYIILMLNLQFS